MAEESLAPVDGAFKGDWKTCTKCDVTKPTSEFYPDRTHGTYRPACKECVKAQNKVACKRRTPAQKADYARRTGRVSTDVPYVTRLVEQEIASIRRIGERRRRVARDVLRVARAWESNDAGVAHLRLHTLGSEEWLAAATASQIATLRRAEFVLASASGRSGERRRLRLSGKWAVGEYEFAVVDAEDYDLLSQWAWKAKWNGSGSGVYAVRNTIINGKNVTLRMHRAVLGIGAFDGIDVDHKDWDTLDNTTRNLRLFTRSQNVKHVRPAPPERDDMSVAA